MTEESTPAKAHLRSALEHLAEHCEPLAGMALKDWYVITVHEDVHGDEVMSRFSRTGQMPWTDAGLLTFALQQEEREWQEDDAPSDDDSFT